ncbi:hypothetical protein GC163_13200 [bacterium]|nr:hypothetical protein [bacterium]
MLDFWADRARWSPALPSERAKFIISLSTLGLYVGGFAVTAIKLYDTASKDAVLLGTLAAIVLVPLRVIVDLYFKGGDAGRRLMQDLDAANAKLIDKNRSQKAAQALFTMRQTIAGLLVDLMKRPSPDEHGQETRTMLSITRTVRINIISEVSKVNSLLAELGTQITISCDIDEGLNHHQVRAIGQRIIDEAQLLESKC